MIVIQEVPKQNTTEIGSEHHHLHVLPEYIKGAAYLYSYVKYNERINNQYLVIWYF